MKIRNPSTIRPAAITRGYVTPLRSGGRLSLEDTAGNEAHPVSTIKFGSGFTVTDLDNETALVSGGGGAPTADVTLHGATGDGVTDDTDAINDAIDALNAAGCGRLYFPCGTYLVSAALNDITAEGIVEGDGVAATTINFTSATAYLFTSAATTRAPAFRDMSLVNTATTPTAGAGIRVTTGGASAHYANLRFENWWTGIRHEDGSTWVAEAITMNGIRKYGFHISNADEDEGDWTIHSCVLAASTHSPDAAIRIDSSGGGRIINCKINGSDPSTGYNHGIDLAFAGSDQSSVLLVSACSIENIRGDGVHITQAGTATYGQIVITGNQINLISNNSGKAVSVVAEDAGAIDTVRVSDNSFMTSGTARTAIALTNVNNADITGNLMGGNFSSDPVYTQSGSTAVVSYYPGAQLSRTTITSPVTVTGTSEGSPTTVITGSSVTFDGVGSYNFTIEAPYIAAPATAGGLIVLFLVEDSTIVEWFSYLLNPAGAAIRVPLSRTVNRTPSAGSHTYTVKGFRDASGVGSATVHAGSGGSGAFGPASLTIRKA